MAIDEHLLAGSERLLVYRFAGRGSGPRIYLQGALHADEVSATVALHRLTELLDRAEQAGQVIGDITVVPHCNPAGLRQFTHGRHLGRFDMRDGRNFNRSFPNLADAVVDRLGHLPRAARTRAVAVAIGQAVMAERREENAGDQLRLKLMQLSWGADIVIDVHADMEAILHIYSSLNCWPVMQGLTQRLGVPIAILADESADLPFDEAHSVAWRRIGGHLAKEGASQAVTAACTVELRGLADVEHEVAMQDALALFGYLADMGALSRVDVPAPPDRPVMVINLEGVEMVRSPRDGVLVHCAALGERVAPGQCIARVLAVGERRRAHQWTEVTASTEGVIFARWHQRAILAGMPICKIAGSRRETTGAGTRLLD